MSPRRVCPPLGPALVAIPTAWLPAPAGALAHALLAGTAPERGATVETQPGQPIGESSSGPIAVGAVAVAGSRRGEA